MRFSTLQQFSRHIPVNFVLHFPLMIRCRRIRLKNVIPNFLPVQHKEDIHVFGETFNMAFHVDKKKTSLHVRSNLYLTKRKNCVRHRVRRHDLLLPRTP